MKICIPVQEDNGLNSVAFNHFGSAPIFLIHDLDNGETKTINNGDLHHAHGMCQPLKAIGGEEINVVLVGGIGAGAIMKLNGMGIEVYRAVNDTAANNIDLFKANKLERLLVDNACSHHDCGH